MLKRQPVLCVIENPSCAFKLLTLLPDALKLEVFTLVFVGLIDLTFLPHLTGPIKLQ